MENAKKQLKIVSLFILIFALLTVVKTVLSILTPVTIPAEQLTDGVTEGLVKIMLIISQVLSLVFVIPHLYVGYKGIKAANGSEVSKAQIVWATILLVLSAIALISGVSSLAGAGDLLTNILSVVISVCDVALYFLYVKYAKQIRNAA